MRASRAVLGELTYASITRCAWRTKLCEHHAVLGELNYVSITQYAWRTKLCEHHEVCLEN
jgi:hypothetical protein